MDDRISLVALNPDPDHCPSGHGGGEGQIKKIRLETGIARIPGRVRRRASLDHKSYCELERWFEEEYGPALAIRAVAPAGPGRRKKRRPLATASPAPTTPIPEAQLEVVQGGRDRRSGNCSGAPGAANAGTEVAVAAADADLLCDGAPFDPFELQKEIATGSLFESHALVISSGTTSLPPGETRRQRRTMMPAHSVPRSVDLPPPPAVVTPSGSMDHKRRTDAGTEGGPPQVIHVPYSLGLGEKGGSGDGDGGGPSRRSSSGTRAGRGIGTLPASLVTSMEKSLRSEVRLRRWGRSGGGLKACPSLTMLATSRSRRSLLGDGGLGRAPLPCGPPGGPFGRSQSLPLPAAAPNLCQPGQPLRLGTLKAQQQYHQQQRVPLGGGGGLRPGGHRKLHMPRMA